MKKPNFEGKKEESFQPSNLEVRLIYAGLDSMELGTIKSFPLVHAIVKTRRALKRLAEELAPEEMVPEFEQYQKELRAFHEKLGEGKTISNPRTGEKVWDINFSSNEYHDGVKAIKEKYLVDKYEAYMKEPLEVPFSNYLHMAPDSVDRDKDIPNMGVYNLIWFLFKD